MKVCRLARRQSLVSQSKSEYVLTMFITICLLLIADLYLRAGMTTACHQSLQCTGLLGKLNNLSICSVTNITKTVRK